jgi:hypothetical protein
MEENKHITKLEKRAKKHSGCHIPVLGWDFFMLGLVSGRYVRGRSNYW